MLDPYRKLWFQAWKGFFFPPWMTFQIWMVRHICCLWKDRKWGVLTPSHRISFPISQHHVFPLNQVEQQEKRGQWQAMASRVSNICHLSHNPLLFTLDPPALVCVCEIKCIEKHLLYSYLVCKIDFCYLVTFDARKQNEVDFVSAFSLSNKTRPWSSVRAKNCPVVIWRRRKDCAQRILLPLQLQSN